MTKPGDPPEDDRQTMPMDDDNDRPTIDLSSQSTPDEAETIADTDKALDSTIEPDKKEETNSLFSSPFSAAAQTIVGLDLGEDGEPTLPEGFEVGKYTIERILGVGGMGAVYCATQSKPNRRVALKLIKPGLMSRKALRRFDLEAEILGRLDHPSIAKILEAGIDPKTGSPYFAMEYVEGLELNKYIASQRLNARQRLELFVKICDAIQHAHSKGIIHRDLKPGNILVTEDTERGGVGIPKILDFGVARATDENNANPTMQTNVGQLVGTLYYMSPEQASGDVQNMDTRSDVYALGVVLFEMLTGHIPYDLQRKALHEAVRTIQEDPPTKLSKHDGDYNGDPEIILTKSLEKERDRRYQSAAEFAADVKRLLSNEPISARPPSMIYKTRMFVRRNKGLTVSAAVIAVIAGVVGTFAFNQWMHRIEARQLALRNMLTELNEMDVQKGMGPALAARLLDLYAKNGPAIFSDDKGSLSTFYGELGSAYHGYEDYESARKSYLKQLDINKSLYGDKTPEVADAYHHVAQASFYLDDFEQARDNYDRTLEIRESLYEPGEPGSELTAETLDHLGTTHTKMGNYENALDYYTRARAIRSELFGPGSIEVAQSLNSLAWFYMQQGQLERTVPIYEENIELLKNLQDDEAKPLWLARSYHALGRVLIGLGRFDEAIETLSEAVRLKEILLGRTFSMGDSLAKLAIAEQGAGRLSDARAHAVEAQEIWRSEGNDAQANGAQAFIDQIDAQIRAQLSAEETPGEPASTSETD